MATVDQIDDQKTHFRHVLYFFFRKGLKPVEAQREIYAVCGDTIISHDTCERWFARFLYGNGSLEDSAISGAQSKRIMVKFCVQSHQIGIFQHERLESNYQFNIQQL